MLKETETEEIISFFVTFLSLVAFQLGGEGRAPYPLLVTPMTAMTFFSLYLGKRQKHPGKYAKTFFFERPIFSKKLASPCAKTVFFLSRLRNIFLETFFLPFFRTFAPIVLGPWSWPRAFLPLASIVSALEKLVLGLGCFCALGFERCFLDSTSGNILKIRRRRKFKICENAFKFFSTFWSIVKSLT